MKKVTAMLLLYAFLVIASNVFWVWSVVSKSKLTERSNTDNLSQSTGADKTKQVPETAREQATELTGEVTKAVKAHGQANDNVNSTDSPV